MAQLLFLLIIAVSAETKDQKHQDAPKAANRPAAETLAADDTSPTGNCPDLRGSWACATFVNGDSEPIQLFHKISQEDKKKGEAVYTLGGEKFTAKWGEQTANKNFKSRCLDGRSLVNWYQRDAIEYQDVFIRVSKETLRWETIRLKPQFGGNNQTVQICKLSVSNP